jgi:hypothetical protein
MRHVAITITITAAFALAPAAQTAPAASKQPLPRSVGPVRLGMPAQAFTRFAHQPPDCTKKDACGPHETRASAFIDTLGVSGGLPQMQQFQCAFIRDTLFTFTTLPEDRRLSWMRSRFSQLYGAPAREDTAESGLGQLVWRSKTTQLMILYVRAQNPKGKTPGTVTGVQYVDVRLNKDAEKDRGDRPWP